jgi:polyisoprenyl-teichoic acid--peptidoglycan teichoic acid transferase
VTRRAAIAVLVLLGWASGSMLGSGVGASAARAATPAVAFGRAHGDFTPALDGLRTITILAVGSDARGGPAVTGRSDSIHVIFLQPRKRRAVIVGIPRDSWVSIPGHGTDKINSAMSSGGPSRLVATIERNFGARIDYWAVTSFGGFESIVNGIGGLAVRVPFRMRDSYSGSNFGVGRQRLNGKRALAFARDRHSVPGGDFGRQENGGRVLESALEQFRREYRRDPGRLLAWIAAGVRHIDTDLAVTELVDLAFTATKIAPARVRNLVLPGGTATIGGKSVVTLSMGAARAIFADAAKDGALRPANVPRSPTGAS